MPVCAVKNYFVILKEVLLEDLFCCQIMCKRNTEERKLPLPKMLCPLHSVDVINRMKIFSVFGPGLIKSDFVSIQTSQLQNAWTDFKNQAFARGGPGFNKE